MMTALAISCGPSTQLGAEPKQVTLSGVSVSEVEAAGGSKTSIVLGWDVLPGSPKKVQIFRRTEGQNDSEAVRIAELTDGTKKSHTDGDTSLAEGKKYIYNLRADDEKAVTVARANSQPIEVIGAANIQAPVLKVPSKPDEKLKDPTGQGVEFEWSDAGTGLYYVSVTDLSGNVLWGAVTSFTKLRYGVESGANTVGGTVQPTLVVPQSLTEKLVISKRTPDKSRKEVEFRGLTPGSYKILVKAIKTSPNAGDLTSATAVAIRPSVDIKFDYE